MGRGKVPEILRRPPGCLMGWPAIAGYMGTSIRRAKRWHYTYGILSGHTQDDRVQTEYVDCHPKAPLAFLPPPFRNPSDADSSSAWVWAPSGPTAGAWGTVSGFSRTFLSPEFLRKRVSLNSKCAFREYSQTLSCIYSSVRSFDDFPVIP